MSQKLGELAKLQRQVCPFIFRMLAVLAHSLVMVLQIFDLDREMGKCDRDVKELTEQNRTFFYALSFPVYVLTNTTKQRRPLA